jgi:alanyl-tRNA synthetase
MLSSARPSTRPSAAGCVCHLPSVSAHLTPPPPPAQARCNHTATHLLQAALKSVLGTDVSQAGSLVDFGRLRFDFNSAVAPSEEQLVRVEALINGWIGDSVEVQSSSMALSAARASGATAMFGEKYGDVVRVVDVPGVSMELCGGTHVRNTAEIGGFKVRPCARRDSPAAHHLRAQIVSESGIAAGVRRIEAVAGPGVYDLLSEREKIVKSLAASLKVQPDKLESRIAVMSEEQRKLAAEVESLKARPARAP